MSKMLVKGDKMCYYRNMAIRPCSNTERGTLMENRKKLAQVIVEHTVETNREVLMKTIKEDGKKDGTEFHQTVDSKGEDGRAIVVKTVSIVDPA